VLETTHAIFVAKDVSADIAREISSDVYLVKDISALDTRVVKDT
jgi:hypothetical protein